MSGAVEALTDQENLGSTLKHFDLNFLFSYLKCQKKISVPKCFEFEGAPILPKRAQNKRTQFFFKNAIIFDPPNHFYCIFMHYFF